MTQAIMYDALYSKKVTVSLLHIRKWLKVNTPSDLF